MSEGVGSGIGKNVKGSKKLLREKMLEGGKGAEGKDVRGSRKCFRG